MDYNAVYERLIQTARLSPPPGFRERHHIIPKCIGGSNHPDNLVELTARQHFVAHLLLAKVRGGKLVSAAWRMSSDGRHGNRKYEWLRRLQANIMHYDMLGNNYSKGMNNPEHIRRLRRINRGNKYNLGRKQTPEAIEARMRGLRGGKRNPDSIARMVATRMANGSYKGRAA